MTASCSLCFKGLNPNLTRSALTKEAILISRESVYSSAFTNVKEIRTAKIIKKSFFMNTCLLYNYTAGKETRQDFVERLLAAAQGCLSFFRFCREGGLPPLPVV
jgi:hypothetical protein